MMLGKWFAVAGCLGFGAVVALSAPGCTVTTGGDVGDGGSIFGDNDAGQDSGLTDTSACAYCLYPACVGAYSVCAGNSECTTILRCGVACKGDRACSDNCFNNHPTGQDAYRLYAACDTVGECGSCGSVCPTQRAQQTCPVVTVPDAGVDDAGHAVDAGPATDDGGIVSVYLDCTGCQADKCASQKAACAPTTSPCAVFNQCVLACADQACIDLCGTANAAGKTSSEAMGTCTVSSCATPCNLPPG